MNPRKSLPRLTPKETLRALRNDIPIEDVITHTLAIPAKHSEGWFRFLCPLCHEFHTATNPRTNLARCFRCQKNWNPIDLVMAATRCSFRDAVEILLEILDRT